MSERKTVHLTIDGREVVVGVALAPAADRRGVVVVRLASARPGLELTLVRAPLGPGRLRGSRRGLPRGDGPGGIIEEPAKETLGGRGMRVYVENESRQDGD